MYKKTLFLLLIVALLEFAPRTSGVSSASDCFWTNPSGGEAAQCLPYDYQNQPSNYTTSYQNPTAATPGGKISQQGNLIKNNSQCLYMANLSWTTQNVSQAEITVFNPDNGQEQVFAQSAGGQGQAPWIQPNKNYRFTLWNTTSGQKTMLDQIWVSGFGLNCGVPDSTQYYPTQPQYGTGSVSITTNQAYCVGQTPTYTISAPTAVNQIVNWTSVGPVGQNQTTFMLSASGTYSGSGHAWQSTDVGAWTKTANSNGTSQSINFTVQNCGGGQNGQGGSTGGTSNNNTSGNNTYYDPYGYVPCITTSCPGSGTLNNNGSSTNIPCLTTDCSFPTNPAPQYPCLNTPSCPIH